MPNPTRPPVYPDFATDGTQRTQPTNPHITTGYNPNDRPPSQEHNWLFGVLGDWTRWLDFFTQQMNGVRQTYDAIVGAAGTHATLNAVMADANIANIFSILVVDPQTLATVQVINHDDKEIYFKTGAVYSKGAGGTPGISVTANRVTIRGARMAQFSAGPDVAIQLEAGSKNCIVTDSRFVNCTKAINDLGTNNALSPTNIEEV